MEKSSATIITSVVSIAAVIVSLSQVWITYSSKEKELEIMEAQKRKEFEAAQQQQDREWNLKMAAFVTEHASAIFSTDEEQRARFREIVLVTFPPHITGALFKNLEKTTSDPKAKDTWAKGQETATQLVVAQTAGNTFAVVGSYRDLAEAKDFANKLRESGMRYPVEIFLAENNYYAVTLGGYLTYQEATNRVDFAKRTALAKDAYVWVSQVWGENLLK